MSLKTFHIFFIVVSILLSVGVGVWGVYRYSVWGEGTSLLVGIVSMVAAVALIVYALKVFRTLGHT